MSRPGALRSAGRTGRMAAALFGFLRQGALILAGLAILAIPDWIGLRASRFRWEDYAGIYALAGFASVFLGLGLGRLWAALFDAGIGDDLETGEAGTPPQIRNGEAS